VGNNQSQIRSFLEEFSMYCPDTYGLVANAYTPEFSASLDCVTYADLINTAAALAQYMGHLQFYGNRYNAEVSKLTTRLEVRVSETIARIAKDAKITDRTSSQVRKAKAFEADPTLKDLEADLKEKAARASLFEYMPQAIREYLNVIKLEIKTRQEKGVLS
jgi:hypothetical protein